MRDEDEARTRFQAPDSVEEDLYVLTFEHRGRLVEKDGQRRIGALLERQSLGEFDHLARGETKFACSQGRVDVEPDPGEPIRAASIIRRRRDHAEPRERPLIGEMEIVRDRHIEQQRLLLKHHRDAIAIGLRRVAQRDRRSVDGNHTRIGLHAAGEDAHQRGLAGAVLADEPHDLMRANENRSVAQRLDRTEALADAFDLQHGLAYLMTKEPLRRIESATAAMIISPCTVSWM